MGDVLVELHMHQAVFFQRMHLAGFRLPRLEKAQGLRDRHLIDQNLPFRECLFGHPVARLDDRRILGMGGDGDIGDLLEEGADGDRIGRVVGAWSMTFRTSSGPMIEAVTCTPPVPQP